jgi:hypothetical protein
MTRSHFAIAYSTGTDAPRGYILADLGRVRRVCCADQLNSQREAAMRATFKPVITL